MTYQFPTGKYDILLADDLMGNAIQYKNGNHYYNNEIMSGGAALVMILAPKTLMMPFLPHRSDDFTFLSLCLKCTKLRKKVCRHENEKSRAFISSYMITDLDFAVSLGYKILHWFEVHHFRQRSYLLKDYVSILNGLKIANSGGLDNLSSDEEKKIYCDNINEKMELPEQFKLTVENVVNNSAQKQTYKSFANNLFGRFSLNSNFSKVDLIDTRTNLLKIVKTHNVIKMSALNDNFCQVEYKPREESKKPNLKGNLYIGSEICARARQVMYQHMMTIIEAKGCIYSCETDGIFYTLPKDVIDPLQFSDVTGHFKAMYPSPLEIISFFALGTRNYCLSYKDIQGSIKNVIKVKGLCLKSNNISDSLSNETYKDYLESHFKNQYKNIYIPQLRKTVNKQTKVPETKIQHYNFSNDLFVKRFVLKDTSYVTYPFGMKFKNVKKD